MELMYKQAGDYLFPNIVANEIEEKNYGKWGQLRRQYLEKHKEGFFNLLTMKNELIEHLNEVDEQAREMWEGIMAKLEKSDPPPSKADDPMAWVRHINNHRAIADDFVVYVRFYQAA